jgi:hypothetical protein
MITKDTASRIAYAYSEIEAAEALLVIMAEAKTRIEPPDFRDVFGRRHGMLQLGVPSGESGRRLFDVNPSLGEVVIKAHIEAKRAEIAALCELAGTELSKEPSQ